MDSWIWIVLLVGLFWFMHRSGVGCCGGHQHRRGESSDEHGGADELPRREESQEIEEGVKAKRR